MEALRTLLPTMGVGFIALLAVILGAWLGHVLHSISRAADALERIADALEADDDDEEEEEGK